jgi:hypothetical protein
VPWPTPQEYNEAIQSPASCFEDIDLQRGTPELTRLGLPRPITGNFASVYRIHSPGHDWAVRCFWREFADLQTRYAAISAHLAASRLPYTVPFQYLERGILVKGRWYPVVKMEWVEGELLDRYVEGHLGDQAALHALATSWKEMCSALEAARIAHGDLQHGNVLVANDTLILVDYDGMVVPALAGRTSHENGHPNYQHPLRTGTDFGQYLDRFSAWSISLALLATAGQPELWRTLNGGDECLLLRHADYLAPTTSDAFTAFDAHPDPQVREQAHRLRSFLRGTPSQVQPLSASPSPPGTPHAEYPHRALSPLVRTINLLAPSVPDGAAIPPVHHPRAGPEWLDAYLPPQEEESVTLLPAPRLWLLIPSATVLSLAALLGAILLPGELIQSVVAAALLPVLAFVVVLLAYRTREPVREMSALLREARRTNREIALVQREMRRTDGEKLTMGENHGRYLASLQEYRERMNADEARERSDLRATLDARNSGLEAEQHSNTEREAHELERALTAIQTRHIHDALRRATIRSASIQGIGWPVKLRLYALGVWAAADLSAEKIKTIGGLNDDELLSLVTWRVECERQARRTAPHALPRDLHAAIGAKYARTRDAIDAEKRAALASWHADDAAIAAEYAEVRADVERKEADARAEFDASMDALDAELTALKAELPPLEAALHEIHTALYPYRTLTLGGYLKSMYLSQRQ